jgi:glutamine synthetase
MVADKLRELADAGVTRVRVHYTDLIGTTRAKVIPLDVLEDACADGLNFCVSVFAIDHTGVMPDGTGIRDEVNFRDMQVVADLETLRVVPWERETAICLADCRLDGEPLETDPRNILRRAIAAAEAQGLDLHVGHELEFFLLRRTDPEGVIREMEDNVRGLGLPFLCVNHEYDPSQWEINTRYADAMTAADEAHLLKLAIKETAALHGLVATFIGRPTEGGGTSGYHLHISAWDGGKNTFDDPDGRLGLSDNARWFMGGLLEHARGMTAICAPTVNAYKRYVAQELGPYFVDWGTDNRSVCVRVPAERGKAARLESRLSDGSASAYLASAAHIFAGVDGVERKLDPGPPTEQVYEPPVERETLPLSLGDALDALEGDDFTRPAFGEQFMQAFTTIKRTEWQRFRLAVTDWELREYADAL